MVVRHSWSLPSKGLEVINEGQGDEGEEMDRKEAGVGVRKRDSREGQWEKGLRGKQK